MAGGVPSLTIHGDWQCMRAQARRGRRQPARQLGTRPEIRGSIYADWGNKDHGRCAAAVDMSSRQHRRPERLALGGHSYGGILTDQVIARDRASRPPSAARAPAHARDLQGSTSTSANTTSSSDALGNQDVYERNSYRACTRPYQSRRVLLLRSRRQRALHRQRAALQALRSLRVPTSSSSIRANTTR